VAEIRALKESLQTDGYDELEAEIVGVRERLARLSDEIEIHRKAEEVKRFKKARRTLADLRRMLNTIKRFKHFDAAELQRWQELDLKRKRYQDDLRSDKKELEKTDKDIRSAAGELAAHEAKAKKAADHLRRIEAEFRPKIDAYQYERAEFRRGEPQSSLYRRGIIVAGAVFVLAVVGYLVRPGNLLAGLGGLALLAGILIAIMLRNLRKSEGALQATIEGLYTESKRYGIKAKSVDELISAVGDLEDEVRSLEQELHVEKADVENLRREKARIENRIKSHNDHVGEVDAEIIALQASTHKDTAADYQAVLDRRTKTEASAAAKQDILREMFPTEATGEAALDEWKARIESQLREADEQQLAEYDAETVAALKDEVGVLKERRQKLEVGLKEGSRRLHSIEVKARELGVLAEPQPCRTTQELDHLGGLIEEYCRGIEEEKKTAQEAVRIFQAIDDEEKTRVGDLFGPESSVSRHVRAITDGRYQAAFYDLRKNAVYLIDGEGERTPVHCLSGGAYDQLYLSIRLSIAERILGDDKGFLILDDPFVKADIDRLGRMMKMLRKLVGDGWQVLYFSAKEEVANTLRDDINSGKVKLIRLEAQKREESTAGTGPAELFD
jgi:DNA repair exonuclease SbcCD ATPase subunit